MAKNTIKIKMLKNIAGIEKGAERTVSTSIGLRMIANKTAEAADKESEEFIASHLETKKKAKEAADKAAEAAQKKKEASAKEAKIKEQIDAVIGAGDRDGLKDFTVKQLLPFALGNKDAEGNPIDENSKKDQILEALIPDDNCTSC